MIDLRCGRYQEAMQDVTCDAVIVDAPYSARTHSGHDATQSGHNGFGKDDADRRAINYAMWTDADVSEFCDFWRDRNRGWFVSITDHTLARSWEAELERIGLYVFTPLPWVAPGSRVRLSGDGPSSWTCWIIVARPKSREFASWGTLPGAYIVNSDKGSHIGGKPTRLMRDLVYHYSRFGQTVVDPCMGYGTTGAACVYEGRNFVGCELDPVTFAAAQERLQPQDHAPLFKGLS